MNQSNGRTPGQVTPSTGSYPQARATTPPRPRGPRIHVRDGGRLRIGNDLYTSGSTVLGQRGTTPPPGNQTSRAVRPGPQNPRNMTDRNTVSGNASVSIGNFPGDVYVGNNFDNDDDSDSSGQQSTGNHHSVGTSHQPGSHFSGRIDVTDGSVHLGNTLTVNGYQSRQGRHVQPRRSSLNTHAYQPGGGSSYTSYNNVSNTQQPSHYGGNINVVSGGTVHRGDVTNGSPAPPAPAASASSPRPSSHAGATPNQQGGSGGSGRRVTRPGGHRGGAVRTPARQHNSSGGTPYGSDRHRSNTDSHKK